VGENGEGLGAFWQNRHPLPPIDSEQRGRGDRGGPPARLQRLPALQGLMAAGNRWRRKRGTGAFHSEAHLGWGWLEEGAPRQGRPAVGAVGCGADGGGGGATGHCWIFAAGVRSGEEGGGLL
jgi:hypothetical protein